MFISDWSHMALLGKWVCSLTFALNLIFTQQQAQSRGHMSTWKEALPPCSTERKNNSLQLHQIYAESYFTIYYIITEVTGCPQITLYSLTIHHLLYKVMSIEYWWWPSGTHWIDLCFNLCSWTSLVGHQEQQHMLKATWEFSVDWRKTFFGSPTVNQYWFKILRKKRPQCHQVITMMCSSLKEWQTFGLLSRMSIVMWLM